MQKGTGIILKLTKLTDTSLIITWCVEDLGLVKTVAKGARRTKSKFAGKLDLFYQADFVWHESKKSELGVLKEISVINYAQGIRHQYSRVMVGSYFIALIDFILQAGKIEEPFYGLLVRALQYLDANDCNKKGFIHFENEVAKLLGVYNPSQSAQQSLIELFGNLPKNRDACLEYLKQDI